MNTTTYKANMSADSGRGPSKAIWADMPILDILEDPSLGMHFFEDFIGCSNIPTAASGAIAQGFNANFSVYASQGATITDGALEGGVITFGSDGDNESVVLGPTAGAFRLVTASTLALNQRLAFEARVSRSSVAATKGDFFVGLIDNFLSSGLPAAGIPISTSDNTLSTTPNLIGFMSKGNAPTEWSFVYQLAGGTAVYPTNLTTLMASVAGAVMTAGQMVKLGFRFDPVVDPKVISSASTGQTAGQLKRPLVTIFVNGYPAAAFLTSDNLGGGAFPTGFMGPCVGLMNQTGSSPPTMSADWVRCCQLANS